jgi:CHAD domain-containing protein
MGWTMPWQQAVVKSNVVKHHSVANHTSASLPTEDVAFATVGAAIMRQQFEIMRAHEPGTRLGEDVEELHQMRVATRRLREALRIFVTEEQRERFVLIQAAARAIGGALGVVRDLDVFRDELRARAEAVPSDAAAIGALVDTLESYRAERRAELLAVLDSPTAQQFWETFPAAVDALERSADVDFTVTGAARRLLRRRLIKLARSAKKLRAPTTSELHDLRIRFKRLRYVGEFVQPSLGRRVEPLVAIATQLQSTLGTMHEGDVLTETLLAFLSCPRSGATSATVNECELTRATLSLLRDRQAKRDELLVKFREQLGQLRKIRRQGD